MMSTLYTTFLLTKNKKLLSCLLTKFGEIINLALWISFWEAYTRQWVKKWVSSPNSPFYSNTVINNLCDPIRKVHPVYFLGENDVFALSNRRFHNLSNDTKLVKIEVILLKVQLLPILYFLLFFLYYTHYFVHYIYLRIKLTDKMYVLL